MMKVSVTASVVLVAMTSLASAHAPDWRYWPPVEQYTYNFSPMPPLLRRVQNHCGYYFGHFICADHCGAGFQVYSCSRLSIGCCHIGAGYCDEAEHLRCNP
jgi:hypothetical protein